MLNEFAPRAMNPGLYSADRSTKALGDLVVAHFMFVKHEERLPVFRPQLLQTARDLFGELSRLIAGDRSARR
jgi:hypothetical protein